MSYGVFSLHIHVGNVRWCGFASGSYDFCKCIIRMYIFFFDYLMRFRKKKHSGILRGSPPWRSSFGFSTNRSIGFHRLTTPPILMRKRLFFLLQFFIYLRLVRYIIWSSNVQNIFKPTEKYDHFDVSLCVDDDSLDDWRGVTVFHLKPFVYV